tara:strand:+ start:281 stop:883 length:603 start_codon:yes stop_codon:yes gene_type:complete
MIPNINIKHGLSGDWSLNSRIEFRQVLKEGLFNQSESFNYNYIHTDLRAIISLKGSLNNSIGGGYLIRLKDNSNMHRFIQQIIFRTEYNSFRLSHRFRSDQSFDKYDTPEFRFRYRISFELPLNGKTLNLEEFYLKLNNEYLNNFKNGYDLELRIIPLIGYTFFEKQRLEFGLDYRVDSFIKTNKPSNRFWISINYFFVL